MKKKKEARVKGGREHLTRKSCYKNKGDIKIGMKFMVDDGFVAAESENDFSFSLICTDFSEN